MQNLLKNNKKVLISLAVTGVLLLLGAIAALSNLSSGLEKAEVNNPSVISNGQSVTVSDLLIQPNNYRGNEISFIGKVFVVEGSSSSGYALQVYSDYKNSDGNIAVISNASIDIEEGDYVEVVGVAGDALEGENAFGASLTVPTVNATNIKVIDADQAVAPTITAKSPKLEKNINGLSVVLEKIEYAAEEIRIYFYFNNRSTTDYSFYSFNTTLTQNRKKISELDDYDRNTYDIDSDILADTEANKVLYFEKVDSEMPFSIKIEITNNKTYETSELEFVID